MTVSRLVNGDCGCYSVPGSGVEHDYPGVIEVGLDERLAFTLTGMHVIEHPFMLFLMGADMMCSGREGPS